MRHAGIEVRIERLVVDASQRTEAAGLADAIGEALQHRLSGSANAASPARAAAPRMVADRIATELSATPRAGHSRGRS
ncbi:hypothetical protein PMI42_07944 [Bradyrhizobium sp. YR681]|uniref:hypothetical protein n=1 Tax=Bradyrhizobium sp. YR681 TaxID=1144344 RepID=UPI00026F51E7|nr:hypothetical protein [Bradyrhizobium sp. YR681]EJN07232.1 hypothetical protein PMI42_07944 [Bradyrhizobium sp. YR681]